MAGKEAPVVGGSIQALCTKCKKATRHVIIAVVGGEAARVQCSQCEGFHNYRAPGGPAGSRDKEGAGSPRAGKGKASTRTLEQEWLAQMKGRDPKQATPYGESPRPGAGDLVEHPTFGYGYVLKVIPPNKVEIHFRGGVRMLRWEA